MFAVTVVDGPDATGASNLVLVLVLDSARPSPALVGHGPACDLRLTQWVSVTMGKHTIQCNGGDSTGTVYRSPQVALTRTY